MVTTVYPEMSESEVSPESKESLDVQEKREVRARKVLLVVPDLMVHVEIRVCLETPDREDIMADPE